MQFQNRKIIFFSLLIIPAIFHLLLIVKLTVNIPRWDDYDVFLNYLNSTNKERLHLLFSQHNEHRIAFVRIVAEIMYQLFGRIDFRLLIFFGNSALFVIYYILYRLFQQIDSSIGRFLPVSLT